MGARIWKEVLCRGRQRDRFGNWFAIGSKQIADAYRNANKMVSRGVPVPCVWEHQNAHAGDPAEARARYAKFTFGHIAGARINDRGNLDLLHDVPDAKDADQLLKTRYVSPKVFPVGFSDSRGGEYAGATIAHVAATPTPVQWWQRPFEFSQSKALYLSYTSEGDAVAEEAKDSAGSTSGRPDDEFQRLVDALREVGLTVPDEVNDIAGLIIAVKAGGKPRGDNDDDDDDDEDDEEFTLPPESGSEVEPAPASTPSGATPGNVPTLMSDERAAPLRNVTRRDLAHRARRLWETGRVDRPTAQRMLGELKVVELSFTTAGDLHGCKIASEIAAYERLPKGLAWKPNGQRPKGEPLEMSLTLESPPSQLAGTKGVDPAVLKYQEELARNLSAGTK